MNLISDVFHFLNIELAGQPINSRIKAFQALKILQPYQYIISKELKDFTLADFNGFKQFLKGISSDGQNLCFKLLTTRSSETINSYLSVYRQYLLSINQCNDVLNLKSSRHVYIPSSEMSQLSDRYIVNEKTPIKSIEVPKYISVDEFAAIIKEIRKNYTIREEAIVRLMFQCGLRLGEVLGMTADDLVVEKVNNEYTNLLYIRNRCSDKPFQSAKTCMKVSDTKQYNSKDYKTKDYGYQTVIVPTDLYCLIDDYIDEAHSEAREAHSENYYKETVADRVRPSELGEDINYYIFINSLGRPLSQVSWNNIIRKIFQKVSIPIDKGRRNNNLNHKFRHGFAMFHVQYLHTGQLELQELMRHRSPLSVSSYFNPTISDAVKLKTDFTKSLYETIPGLKRGEE